MTRDGIRRRPALGSRLVIAFVAVAVLAVLVLAGLMLWRTRSTVGELARDRQQASADAIAETLAIAYRSGGGWTGVDAHPAQMLSTQAAAELTVTDPSGATLTLASSMGMMPHLSPAPGGPERTAPVVVDGRTVGIVRLRFASSGLAEAETHVRDALGSTIFLGTAAAAAVALLIAVPTSARIVRPLRRLTGVARSLGDGRSGARAGGHDDPGELGALNAAFDEMAERLEAQDTARRHLATDIAHELRTPLTLLRGSCEEVIDGIAAPSIERFTQMHDDVLRLSRLVDDLSSLADADAALTEPFLALTRCDLAAVAAVAADAVTPMFDARGQRIERRLEPAPVFGDARRLEQVVTNLLTNAAKYAPESTTVTVRTESAGGTARLRVIDQGGGLDPAEWASVLGRFTRGPNATGVAGSGIGLAVVDQLVRAHHGTVGFERSAAGFAVSVSLPVQRSPRTTRRPRFFG